MNTFTLITITKPTCDSPHSVNTSDIESELPLGEALFCEALWNEFNADGEQADGNEALFLNTMFDEEITITDIKDAGEIILSTNSVSQDTEEETYIIIPR